jgi:hypothetical protein
MMMIGIWKSAAMASAKTIFWSDSVEMPGDACRRGV